MGAAEMLRLFVQVHRVRLDPLCGSQLPPSVPCMLPRRCLPLGAWLPDCQAHRQGAWLPLSCVQEAEQDLLGGAGAVGEVHLVVADAVLREPAGLIHLFVQPHHRGDVVVPEVLDVVLWHCGGRRKG